MLFGFTLATSQMIAIVLFFLVVLLASKSLMRKLLRLDDKIDDRQEVWSRLAGLCTKIELPKVASICHKIAAINVDEAIQEIRLLVDGAKDEEAVLLLLRENFLYQLPKRLTKAEGREAVVKAVLGDPVTKAEIEAALAEATAKAKAS